MESPFSLRIIRFAQEQLQIKIGCIKKTCEYFINFIFTTRKILMIFMEVDDSGR